jgi:hypothetical protein
MELGSWESWVGELSALCCLSGALRSAIPSACRKSSVTHFALPCLAFDLVVTAAPGSVEDDGLGEVSLIDCRKDSAVGFPLPGFGIDFTAPGMPGSVEDSAWGELSLTIPSAPVPLPDFPFASMGIGEVFGRKRCVLGSLLDVGRMRWVRLILSPTSAADSSSSLTMAGL